MSTPPTPPTPPPPPITDDEYKAATEHLWKTYQVINEWIRFADAKAGALLTVNGVLIGAAVGKIDADQKFHSDQGFYWVALILAIACGICLIISGAYSLRCINPILSLKKLPPPPKKSTIYFDHIAQHIDVADFHTGVLNVKGEKLAFEEIAEQVYAVSKVATDKHAYIKISVLTLGVGLALGVALLAVLSGLTYFPGGTS